MKIMKETDASRRTTYIIIHVEMDKAIIASCPDFPGVSLPGDRLADTLTVMPIILQRHVDEMLQRGERPPTPTVPDLWDIHAKDRNAIISFVEIITSKD
jgi:predicted RNase H-like HicB family nuclease